MFALICGNKPNLYLVSHVRKMTKLRKISCHLGNFLHFSCFMCYSNEDLKDIFGHSRRKIFCIQMIIMTNLSHRNDFGFTFPSGSGSRPVTSPIPFGKIDLRIESAFENLIIYLTEFSTNNVIDNWGKKTSESKRTEIVSTEICRELVRRWFWTIASWYYHTKIETNFQQWLHSMNIRVFAYLVWFASWSLPSIIYCQFFSRTSIRCSVVMSRLHLIQFVSWTATAGI